MKTILLLLCSLLCWCNLLHHATTISVASYFATNSSYLTATSYSTTNSSYHATIWTLYILNHYVTLHFATTIWTLCILNHHVTLHFAGTHSIMLIIMTTLLKCAQKSPPLELLATHTVYFPSYVRHHSSPPLPINTKGCHGLFLSP